MLDVHPPHKPMHGFWEFLLHLFTITVGLLIATQIESFVEWRHHQHMVHEAREYLKEEIEQNLSKLQKEDPEMKRWRGDIQKDLNYVQGIIDRPNDSKAQDGGLDVSFRGFDLQDTAWKIAQSNGVLSYMPYSEATRYADIYSSEEQILENQKKLQEDISELFGMISMFHLQKNQKITKEQAATLAGKLGVTQMHLMNASLFLSAGIDQNESFLQGRKPKNDYTETIR